MAQQRPVSAASPLTCSPNVLYDLAEGEPSCYPVPIDDGGGGGGGGCSYPSPIPQLVESALYPDRLNGVSLATGEFIETVTDIEVKDPLGSIPFARTYRSYLKADGVFGFRWMHNYEERLDFPADPDWDADCGHVVRWWRPGQHFIDFIWNKQDSEYVAIGAPSFKLQRDPDLWWPSYSIREVGGSVRAFGSKGQLLSLADLRGRTIHLRYDSTGVESKLDRIESSGPGWTDLPILQLHYDGDRVSRLEGLDGRTAEYSYSACGDLVAVTYDGVTSGYQLDGTADSVLRNPVTHYEYSHGSNDCTELALDDHLLTAISVDTFDPISGEESLATRVRNVYGEGDDWNDGKVIRHCVDQASCTEQDPHYSLQWQREPGSPQAEWLHTTELWDLRDPEQPYASRRSYFGSKLLSYERDIQPGGLALQTEYRYDSRGQRTYEKRADGTCTERGYQEVGDLSLLQFERERSATSCASGQPDPTDRVKFYRYESLNGLIRSVTGPEAFPNGVIPWGAWEPEQPGYLEHSVFYDYDFNQSAPGEAYPAGLEAYLEEWKLFPPRQLGDVNGDPSDDAYWTGASTRVRKQLIDPETGAKSWASSSTVVNAVGQPLIETGADGVRTVFEYYDSLVGDWDWRLGSTFSSLGIGPLARTQIESKDGSLAPLESRYAWTPQELLAARQDPTGLRVELSRDAGGRVVQEVICNPLTPVARCSALAPTDQVIRVDRAGFDLQSRRVLSESLDAQQLHVDGSLKRLHRAITRFDLAGRAVQQVIDPDPVAPFSHTPPSTDHLHASTRTIYDVKGQRVQSISPEGRHVCEQFGSRGQSTRSTVLARMGQDLTCADTHSSDITTQSFYDAYGRQVESRAGTGLSSYLFYDDQSRVAAVADGAVPGLIYSGATSQMSAATSWERTYFDDLGRAARVEVHGTHGDGTSGLLAVRWSEFGTSGRFWRSSVLRFESTLDPALVATLAPPTDVPEGTQLIQTVTRYDGLEVSETIDGAGRATRYQADALGRAHRIENRSRRDG